jgi:pimeloyl-ACP methyl ester carboxylesterase
MWFAPLTLGLVALYAAVIAVMYFAQTWLIFPTTLVGAAGAELPTSAQRLEIKTPDGAALVGVRLSGNGAESKPSFTLLGFGGNAWNADAMALYLRGLFPDRDVVTFHYRGYAPSGGKPSAQAIMGDALLILDHLKQAHPRQNVVAIGFSIGSGVAAHLARQRPTAGLILVTPFDSLKALAQDHYWWAPVGLLLRHRMPTIDLVRETFVPTALITAEQDTIVPARRSAPLRSAIRNLVLERVIDAGHNDLYDHPAFTLAMRDAISKIEVASPAGSAP